MLNIAYYNATEHWQRSVEATAFSLGSDESAVDLWCGGDSLISPKHLLLERCPDSDSEIGIANFAAACVVDNGIRIFRGVSRTVNLPVLLGLGHSKLEIATDRHTPEGSDCLQHLPQWDPTDSDVRQRIQSIGQSPSAATLLTWFDALAQLNRHSAGSAEFLQQATDAVFDPGGLDNVLIVGCLGGQWVIEASRIADATIGLGFDPSLVFARPELRQPGITTSRESLGSASRLRYRSWPLRWSTPMVRSAASFTPCAALTRTCAAASVFWKRCSSS